MENSPDPRQNVENWIGREESDALGGPRRGLSRNEAHSASPGRQLYRQFGVDPDKASDRVTARNSSPCITLGHIAL